MRFLIFILTLCSFFVSIAQSKNFEKVIKSSDDSSVVCRAYEDLIEYYSLSSIDSAIFYSKAYLFYADENQIVEKQIIARSLLTSFYEDASMFQFALNTCLEAFDLAKKEDVSVRTIAILHQNLGWIYDNLDDYEKSFFHFRESLRLSKLNDDKEILGYSHYCIGSSYVFGFGRSENGSNYADSAIYHLELANNYLQESTASFDSVANIETELAYAYAFFGRVEKAKAIISKLDRKYDQMGPYHQGYTDAARYHVFKAEGEYEKALKGFQRLLELTTDIGLGTTEESINLLEDILELSKHFDDDSLKYATFNELRKREGEWLEIQKLNKTSELSVQYETAQKERDLRYREDQVKQKNLIIYLIGSVSFITLLALFVLISLLKKLRNQNYKIKTLMRELHHRVKNNLQVISSLLELQSSKLTDSSAQRAVEEGQERIRAMSLIHQKLYKQNNVSSVDLNEYLRSLIYEISETYGFQGKASINIEVPEILMDVDTTLPIGLIVNELVTNSFKYAFDAIDKPVLTIAVTKESEKKFYLQISDNGRGLPDDFDFDQAKSFGLKLVKLLTRQLGAKLEINQTSGLQYGFEFEVK